MRPSRMAVGVDETNMIRYRAQTQGDPQGALHRLLLLGLAGLALSVLCVALAESWWVFDLATHFRPHYVAAALPLALLALALKRRRLAVLAAVLVLPHLAMLDSMIRVESARAAPSMAGQGLTLMTANLLWSNGEQEAAIDQILALQPDVVVLQEGVGSWHAALQRLAAHYPHRSPGRSGLEDRVQVFSRLPLRSAELHYPDGQRFAFLHAELELGGRAVHLLAVHAPLPMARDLSHFRNLYLRDLARHASSLDGPVVVAGDFNITPWSPYFQKLITTSGLSDSAGGRAWLPTWPSWLPVGGIPIDHVLINQEVAVESLRRAGPAGSDHYPLIAELTIR